MQQTNQILPDYLGRFLPHRKALHFILPFAAIIFQSIVTLGQHDTLYQGTRINKEYIVSYWKDTKAIASEPFHWKLKQWSFAAGIAGIGIVTYVYDQDIYDFFQDHRTSTTENISKYLLEPWGSGLYSLPLLAGIYIISPRGSRHRQIALTGVKAFILSGGAAAVSKHLFHRHRPGDDDPPDPRQWEGPFPFTMDFTSFPSGHATTAFAVATVLAMGYQDHLWVGVSSYTLATLTSLSRIHDSKHWASDVVAGGALGFFIGATLSKVNFKKVRIEPAAFRGGQGIKLTWNLN